MHKTQRKKKERPKQKKDKEMGILYSYIVKDVVDEMKLSIHPVIRPVIHPNTTNIYLKKGP